jgi:hypothetical protein
MARTTQKRRRRKKRRGTQAGTIDRRGPRGRPRTRAEARSRAKSRTSRRQPVSRQDRVPTWRGAVNRGAIAAGVFLLLLIVLFKQPIPQAISLAAFMLVIYIPMGYYLDRFFYRMRLRREAREREKRAAEK